MAIIDLQLGTGLASNFKATFTRCSYGARSSEYGAGFAVHFNCILVPLDGDDDGDLTEEVPAWWSVGGGGSLKPASGTAPGDVYNPDTYDHGEDNSTPFEGDYLDGPEGVGIGPRTQFGSLFKHIIDACADVGKDHGLDVRASSWNGVQALFARKWPPGANKFKDDGSDRIAPLVIVEFLGRDNGVSASTGSAASPNAPVGSSAPAIPSAPASGEASTAATTKDGARELYAHMVNIALLENADGLNDAQLMQLATGAGLLFAQVKAADPSIEIPVVAKVHMMGASKDVSFLSQPGWSWDGKLLTLAV